MLNDKMWLAHSDLFVKHWVVETKPWVRSLGWFTDFMDTVKDTQGWGYAGDRELTVFDYIQIIDSPLAEKKLYCCANNSIIWEHISTVVFVVRKDDETFIVGWAGEKKFIEKMKKTSDSPWDWPDKILVDVDPVLALRTMLHPREEKKSRVPVFFVSNNESNADDNWAHLVKLCPRAVRIDGIQGRRKMFHRCVDLAAGAPHFFLVTGKNFITDSSVFDYSIENIRNAHVVFNAKNMSNRLEYGHMGVVCYNSHQVLNTPEDFGLDFTQYSNTVSVPITVSEATFSSTPYEAWRTAFRETVKLAVQNDTNSQLWLDRWLAFAEGNNSDSVIRGAKMGRAYGEKYRDDPEQLRKTENWDWLDAYYVNNKQPVTPAAN